MLPHDLTSYTHKQLKNGYPLVVEIKRIAPLSEAEIVEIHFAKTDDPLAFVHLIEVLFFCCNS